jgi:hypothetical protein
MRQGHTEGNQFWRNRKEFGQNRRFAKPIDLWEACKKYLEWCEDTPLREEKVFQYKGDIVRTTVTHPRAMSISSLCAYIGIQHMTWLNYRKHRRKDFREVVEFVEACIWDQKFTGAAAGLLNPSIIAMELGLAAKRERDEDEETAPPLAISFNVAQPVTDVKVTRGS